MISNSNNKIKALWTVVKKLSGTCTKLVNTPQALTRNHFNDNFLFNVKSIFMNISSNFDYNYYLSKLNCENNKFSLKHVTVENI